MSISEILSRIPDDIKRKLTPEYMLMSVHGIEIGKTFCVECKELLTESDKSRCENCFRPWPRICGINKCTEEVMVDRHVNSKGGVEYYESAHCGCLYAGDAEQGRTAGEEAWRSMYRDEPRVIGAVEDFYSGEESRADAAESIRRWYREGKVFKEWRPLYVHGPSGSGKSVMVANAMRHALSSRVFKGAMIIKESQLKTWASRNAGNEEGYSSKWKRLHDVPALVIDLWDQSRARRLPHRGLSQSDKVLPGYTQTQYSGVAGLLRHRFEHSYKATIFISLLPPAIGDFGEDVNSRWNAGNHVARVGSVDFRAKKGVHNDRA